MRENGRKQRRPFRAGRTKAYSPQRNTVLPAWQGFNYACGVTVVASAFSDRAALGWSPEAHARKAVGPMRGPVQVLGREFLVRLPGHHVERGDIVVAAPHHFHNFLVGLALMRGLGCRVHSRKRKE